MVNNLNEWKASNKTIEDLIILEQELNTILSTNLQEWQLSNQGLKNVEIVDKEVDERQKIDRLVDGKYIALYL